MGGGAPAGKGEQKKHRGENRPNKEVTGGGVTAVRRRRKCAVSCDAYAKDAGVRPQSPGNRQDVRIPEKHTRAAINYYGARNMQDEYRMPYKEILPLGGSENPTGIPPKNA